MNNSKTYIISDTHFYHDAMVQYCGRPQDFTEQIIHNWSNVIHEDDLVYHLGDVYFGKKSVGKECLRALPGLKILIRGNHDRKSLTWYRNNGFVAVMNYAVIPVNMKVTKNNLRKQRILLSHKPMDIVPVENCETLNIHGHFHNVPSDRWEPDLIKKITNNHYLLSLEETNYKPVTLYDSVYRGLIARTAERL